MAEGKRDTEMTIRCMFVREMTPIGRRAMARTSDDQNSSPLVPHVYVGELGQNWFRWWLFACSTTSPDLNQCWLIVNWTISNKLPWNLNKNTSVFIDENSMVDLLSFLVRGLRGAADTSVIQQSCGTQTDLLNFLWYFEVTKIISILLVVGLPLYAWNCLGVDSHRLIPTHKTNKAKIWWCFCTPLAQQKK